VGKVVASANPAFEVGDIVSGFYQVAEYAIVPGGDLRKIDTSVVKPSDYLGILGKFLDLNIRMSHCHKLSQIAIVLFEISGQIHL